MAQFSQSRLTRSTLGAIWETMMATNNSPAALLLCASLVSVSHLCDAQSLTLAEKPSIKVGQVAVYVTEERADKRTSEDTQTVVSVEGDVVRIKSVNLNRSPVERETLSTTEWNAMVSSVSGSKFVPHTGILQFPLSIGKTWQAKLETTTTTGARLRSDLETKVVGVEKVDVPAGSFDTFKIEQAGWINGVTFAGSLRMQQLTWYAPSIGRVVKSEYKDWSGSPLPRAHNIVELKSLKDPS